MLEEEGVVVGVVEDKQVVVLVAEELEAVAIQEELAQEPQIQVVVVVVHIQQMKQELVVVEE